MLHADQSRTNWLMEISFSREDGQEALDGVCVSMAVEPASADHPISMATRKDTEVTLQWLDATLTESRATPSHRIIYLIA